MELMKMATTKIDKNLPSNKKKSCGTIDSFWHFNSLWIFFTHFNVRRNTRLPLLSIFIFSFLMLFQYVTRENVHRIRKILFCFSTLCFVAWLVHFKSVWYGMFNVFNIYMYKLHEVADLQTLSHVQACSHTASDVAWGIIHFRFS